MIYNSNFLLITSSEKNMVNSRSLGCTTSSNIGFSLGSVSNSPPTVSNIQINAGTSQIYISDNLRVTWTFSDPDPLDVEDLSSTLIIWSLNGVIQSQFTNVTLIPAANVVKGQCWSVIVAVRDNGGLWSEPQNSSHVVIKNSVPTITIPETAHPEFIIEDEAL